MPLASAVRLATGVIYGLAVICCLGAFCVAGYRLRQMNSLEKVSALVLRAGPSVYMVRTASKRPYERVSFAKKASADMSLCCNAFITVMQTAELRDLDDPSGT